MTSWMANLLGFMRTLGQILTAGIAITAFALLLYSFAFNLRDRVARSFALILTCIVVVFSAEAIGSTASTAFDFQFWPRVQWVGIAFLPAVYLHFSDALLATTGRPSRWRRRLAVRLVYMGSFVFMLGLPFGHGHWARPAFASNPVDRYFHCLLPDNYGAGVGELQPRLSTHDDLNQPAQNGLPGYQRGRSHTRGLPISTLQPEFFCSAPDFVLDDCGSIKPRHWRAIGRDGLFGGFLRGILAG
jgi:hypothetical protein